MLEKSILVCIGSYIQDLFLKNVYITTIRLISIESKPKKNYIDCFVEFRLNHEKSA